MKVGIDISINSTSVYIKDYPNDRCFVFTKKSQTNKYIKGLSQFGTHIFTLDEVELEKELSEKNTFYTNSELIKTVKYTKLAKEIVGLICDHRDKFNHQDVLINIEGYAYVQNSKSQYDLINLSSLIRSELFKNDLIFNIVAPITLKKNACEFVYGYDSNGVSSNELGVKGAKFKKHEMLKSLYDGQVPCIFLEFINDNYEPLMKLKKIPTPLEDIVDSLFLANFS